MKKLAIIIGMMVGIASISFAQEIKLGGNLGYFMGSGDVKDTYGDSGLTLGGLVRYSVAPQIDVVGGVDYYKLSKESNKKGTHSSVPSGSITAMACKDSLRVIPITVSCLYNIPIQPNILGYVGGGVGIFMAKRNIEKVTVGSGTAANKKSSTEESKSPFGFQILGGCDYTVSPNISINGQVKYAYAKVKDWKDINIGGTSISVCVVYTISGSKKE